MTQAVSRAHAWTLSLALLLAFGRPVDAQFTSTLAVGRSYHQDGTRSPTAPFLASASLTRQSARMGLDVATRLALPARGIGEASEWLVGAGLRLPLVSGVRFVATSEAEGIGHAVPAARWRLGALAGAELQVADMSLRALVGGMQLRNASSATGATESRVAFTRAGGRLVTTFTGRRVSYHEPQLTRRDTTFVVAGFPFTSFTEQFVDVERSYADLELGATFLMRHAVVTGQSGIRTGAPQPGRQRWASVGIEAPRTTRLAIQWQLGTRPDSPELASAERRFTSLALVFRHIPRAEPPAIESDATGAVVLVQEHSAFERVRLWAPRAATVEVMGDFNDWRPEFLVASGAGRWQREARLDPGLYQFLIRVDDGPWQVPVGASSALNAFGDPVGVLVVR